MKLIETEVTNQFTFEPFTAHTFYTEINRSLVKRSLAALARRTPASPWTIVDMACGTGAVTRLIAEEVACQGYRANIIGVDPSAEALRRAERSLVETGLNATFIHGETSDLSSFIQSADAVFFSNAIHLLDDKGSAFRQIAALLVSGGIFACNSAFYNGAYVEGTERFYRLWTRRAIAWLRKEYPDIQPSRTSKAAARQWLDVDEYICLLAENGFGSIDATQESAIMTLDSYRDIGQYWLFIEGALPGVPLPIGATALGIAVYQAGQELGITHIPRNWLQIVATKA